MTDLNTQHHSHIVVGLREEASNGDSTCSQLAEDAADYIELLEYHLRCDRTWQSRAEKLEAALRGVIAVADRDAPEFRFARHELNTSQKRVKNNGES